MNINFNRNNKKKPTTSASFFISIDKSKKCISTTTIQRRGAICIIVNNPDEDTIYDDDDNDNDDENNNTNESDNSGGGGGGSSSDGVDGASTYRKQKQKRSGRDKTKYRSDASAAMNDDSSVSGVSAQVQATKRKSWHDFFLVTQKRKKRKSTRNKFKAKSKPYKCHNNYPTKTSRKCNKKHGNIYTTNKKTHKLPKRKKKPCAHQIYYIRLIDYIFTLTFVCILLSCSSYVFLLSLILRPFKCAVSRYHKRIVLVIFVFSL